MAEVKIIFAENAYFQLHEILEKYRLSTGATARSISIYEHLTSGIRSIANTREAIETNVDGVYARYVDSYIIFFQADRDELFILKIWDCSKK